MRKMTLTLLLTSKPWVKNILDSILFKVLSEIDVMFHYDRYTVYMQ